MDLLDISHRIKTLVDYYAGGNNTKFAQLTDTSEANIRNYIAGTKPRFDFISNLANRFEINCEWLLTGKGYMLKSDEETFETENATNFHYNNIDVMMVSEEKLPYYGKDQCIPLYDTYGAAGCVSLFQNNHASIPIDTIKIPDLPPCDGAIFVRGDSMYPVLKSGDIVLYKTIPELDTIIWGETYIVCYEAYGDYYTVVKYVKKSTTNNGCIILISQNEHHQPFEISLSQVKAMALVRASIRYNNM